MATTPRTPPGWRAKFTRKRILWATVLAALAFLLVLAFRPSPLDVEAGTVTRGLLEVTIDAEGTTRVVDRYQIAAPVAGRLQRITAREGDMVQRGAVVATIAPTPLDPQAASQARAAVVSAEARLEEANARVLQARAAFEQAQRTAGRIRQVVAEGGMSADALDRADLEAATAAREHEASQSRVRAATSEVNAARAALQGTEQGSGSVAMVTVTAPSAGRILRIHERSERVVPPGTPLLEIGDAAGLEVVVDVLSTDAVRIVPGAPLRVDGWGGDRTLHGQVRVIEPSAFTRVSALGVQEQRVHVIGDLAEAPAALGDGYRVEARIVVWSESDALKVPGSALFQTADEWAVFVVENGTARLRPVEIGQRGVADAEVTGGLAEGDIVILFPSDQLRDGSAIRIAR